MRRPLPRVLANCRPSSRACGATRLVELDGAPATARRRVSGRLAAAYRTNLLGQIIEPLKTAPAEPPPPGLDEWSAVTAPLRAYEIATLYLDLELGCMRSRNLDKYRHVWATAHRVDSTALRA